jgi:Tol biopolymer transport system component
MIIFKQFPFLLMVVLLFSSCNKNPVNNGGGGPEPFILSKYFDFPAWHPDGTWIAAEHGDSLDTDDDGRKDEYFGGIWLVHAETGSTQPLIRGYENPAWSPDGTRLAMEAGGHIFTIEITSLDPALVDTSSLLQLTTEGRNYFPDWSPDGEWIAFDSNFGNQSTGYYDLWKMHCDGSSKKRIEVDYVGSRVPNWSPDGKYIVHQRTVVAGTGAPEIFVVDTSGYNPLRLTYAEQEADMYPRYSPDGTRIAWCAHRKTSSGNWAMNVWIMNSDGSNPKKVTSDHAWRFGWSPDGSQLVFLYWDTLTERPGNGELWLINVDGSGLRQLTHFKDRDNSS